MGHEHCDSEEEVESKYLKDVDQVRLQETAKSEYTNSQKSSEINSTNKIIVVTAITAIFISIVMQVNNIQNEKISQISKCLDNEATSTLEKSKYWVYGKHSDVNNEDGLLKHVHIILKRVGYEKSTNESNWSLLWSHDYPFRVLYPHLHRLKHGQLVNHFPGTGFITNKVDLATTDLKHIPKAFKLPQDSDKFKEYVRENPASMFLQKHNQHRGVYLKNVTDINLENSESFVQEYVGRPFLVDGHKFDIGVYTVITSVDPLRVYWYKGDVLFRYCPSKYYPFDPSILDKYVIGDDYLPTWEVPSLTRPYNALGFGMKGAFDSYVLSKGKNPSIIWAQVLEAIREVFVNKEHHIINALKNYPYQRNFFELMRFDLVVDADLKVHLLEANMSPNLSSAHYPPNQLLYEQLLYNVMALVGVATYTHTSAISPSDAAMAKQMVSTDKNIAAWSAKCLSADCQDSCEGACQICRPCLNVKTRSDMIRAHSEHIHRGDFRRLHPPELKFGSSTNELTTINISTSNGLHTYWMQGKCNEDPTWCF